MFFQISVSSFLSSLTSSIFNLVLLKILVPISLFATDDTLVEELAHKEDDLNAAYDGKAGKESHRASNETHL